MIVAVSAGLRLYQLDFKSLWLDELYSIVPTNPNNDLSFVIEYSKSDQPPFYFILLHYWFKVFPYTSFFGRLFSAALGVIAVIAMFFLGKEAKDEETGLFAAALTGLNYFHIYYSQECRFYILLFLLTVTSFIFFIRSLKHKTPANYFLYSISTLLLLYTHYFGIIVFLIQGSAFIYYVILFRPGYKFVLVCFGLGILIAGLFTPWLPTLLRDTEIDSYWIERPAINFLLVYYYIYWGKDVFTCVVSALVAVLYLQHTISLVKDGKKEPIQLFVFVLLLLWILISYALPYLWSLFSIPVLLPRYTVIALPAIFLCIALGFTLIKSELSRFSILALVVISICLNIFYINEHYLKTDKAQWREAAHVVLERHRPGVLVYSNQEWWYNFFFYTAMPPIKVLGQYSHLENIDVRPFIDLVTPHDQFWVLSGEGMNGLTKSQQDYVNDHFIVTDSHAFFAASAVLYERKKPLNNQ